MSVTQEKRVSERIATDLGSFSPQDAAIETLRGEFTGLAIDGVADRAGYKAVHDARMTVRGHRVKVEATRKELKADALAYGRAVDTEAKRLTEMLREIEQPLHDAEKAIDEERAAIKAEEERRAQAVLDERVAALHALGSTYSVSLIAALDDVAYGEHLANAQHAHDRRVAEEKERAELERADAEKAAEVERAAAAVREEERKKEEERQAAEAKKLAEERAKLDSERRKLAEERAAADRAREIEDAKRQAAEAERARVARERAEAEAKARRESEDEARREAARPTVVKLAAFAEALREVAVPDVPGHEAQLRGIVGDAAERVLALAEEVSR